MTVIHVFVGTENVQVVDNKTIAVFIKVDAQALNQTRQIEDIQRHLQALGYNGLIVKVGSDAQVFCLDEEEMNQHGWYRG